VALVATYIALEGHYGRLDHTHAGSVAAFSILFAVATLAGAALADGFESWNAGASEPGPATWYDGDAPFEEDPGEPLELDSLETILTGAVAAHGALSLLLARPDGIDGLGHDRGQRATRAVLECVADVLRGHLRGTDVLHRHGLFEFWVVLPRTSLEAARMTAERVRLAVGELPVSLGEGDQERCSLSIGIASCPIDGRSPASLRDAAERALAGAVELGGNRTVLHSVPPGAPRGWGLAREVPVGAAQLARRSLE
jgi:diguanylate cyclase (GGDEF)-like protein